MTISLPCEIWGKILECLPSDTCIIRLRAVNRFFLEFARKLLYRKLSINNYNEKTKRLLKGISSLCLGHYVQSLHIQPWVVTSTPSQGPVGQVSSALDHVHSIFDSDYDIRKAQALLEKQKQKQIQLVTDTANKLEHVREYSVDWDVDKTYHAELFTAFLTLLNVSPFSRTLTLLTLRVPTDRLVCLALIHLPVLEELDVHLVTQLLPELYINNCLEHLIVFANNHLQILRSLSLSSTDLSLYLNLSKFFHLLSMTYFPRLQSFSLSIPYDGMHLPNETNGPENLRFFISRHSRNLHHLKLSSESYPHSSSISTSPGDPLAKYWIQRSFLSPDLTKTLVSLVSLKLAIRPLRGDLTPFFVLISSVAHQLESLVLTDYPLPLKEVVDALTHTCPSSPHSSSTSPLRHLSLHLQYLSPSTFDLLASKFASLRSLELTFEEIQLSHSAEHRRHFWFSTPEHDFSAAFIPVLFWDELSSRCLQGTYDQWNLSSLALSADLEHYYPHGMEYSIDVEEVFRRCIPSLVNFYLLD
ncbi:hypothetical protein GYMLUDRAFT_62602 [Collybiopsis luxurians FD-317 M1]|uniref:Unplaced genomic scaffold GYMLUscaffold_59, whole genome shotgun sequence n=1 Tax=Collybiopsis luxurians FD-317 M1 TaxID=944289 RepID=A0A0D0BKM4_9AGAR|nr:hypothetical protein GYMLUDRAFT_62602 [Collybiopsis luxurians FD-317 M1]